MAYLSHEPVGFEWPETGEGVEKEGVGVRRQATVKETNDYETIYYLLL